MRAARAAHGLAERRIQGAILAAAAAILLLLSRSMWLPSIGRFLVIRGPLQEADAIVVLAGNGRDRMEEAAGLFRSGYAPWLVVTNMPLHVLGIRVDYADLMRAEAVWQGVPEQFMVRAPAMADTTYEEALAVGQLAAERGWRSLIVVTDPFHARTALMSFREALRGTGVTISVRLVSSS